MHYLLIIPARILAMVVRKRYCIYKITLMILILITALYTKEYRGEHQMMINNHIGGILYVLFGSLLFSVIFPSMKPYKSVLLALTITCLLEFVQWFRFPFMLELTKIKAFAYLLGNSFNPYDFIYYGIGALLGFMVLFLLSHHEPLEA
jgi:hypothetical protein